MVSVFLRTNFSGLFLLFLGQQGNTIKRNNKRVIRVILGKHSLHWENGLHCTFCVELRPGFCLPITCIEISKGSFHGHERTFYSSPKKPQTVLMYNIVLRWTWKHVILTLFGFWGRWERQDLFKSSKNTHDTVLSPSYFMLFQWDVLMNIFFIFILLTYSEFITEYETLLLFRVLQL